MKPSKPIKDKQALAYCRRLAASHYENFPVASILLPRKQRQAITAIYAFARSADDLADEGDAPAKQRLADLTRYQDYLEELDAPNPPVLTAATHEQQLIFHALWTVIARHGLTLSPFHALLRAFKQDVTQQRYPTLTALLDYCAHSADPIGQLLLQLHGIDQPKLITASNHICSSLQLLNFLQDVQSDYTQRNRIYLPQAFMPAYADDAHFLALQERPALEYACLRLLSEAKKLLLAGAPLGAALSGRFGVEIRCIIEAAKRLIRYLEQRPDPLIRPYLRRRDYIHIGFAALFQRRS